MEKLSIIILFHNNPRINIVIDSIINQKHDDDEIIIVNDHSTEECLRNLDCYRNDSSISIISTEIAGNRSYNRNIGASHAKNPVLLFVDGDIVLMKGCLDLLRTELQCDCIATFGNIIQGGNTPEQMNLLLGLNYLDFLEKSPKLDDFFALNIAHDSRIDKIHSCILSKSKWQIFYSGYCMVRADAFNEVGGFNETFKGWGAEDVELGYRLEKIGDLKYVGNAYAFHLSHDRDFWAILNNNKQNLYLFYHQCPVADIELFLACNLNIQTLDAMEYIKNRIINLNISPKHILYKKGQLSITIPSSAHPNGCVSYLDSSSKRIELELIGMALPFNNAQFDRANLTTDIFNYPEAIATKILQECLRVSERVLIYKTNRKKPTMFWNSSVVNSVFANKSKTDRIKYNAYFINDFSFSDKGKYYEITGGIATKMPDLNINNLPEIYPDRHNKKFSYLLFDFTNNLSDEQIIKIAQEKEIEVKGVYRIPTFTDDSIVLSKVIYGELQLLNMPFLYILKKPMTIDMTDIWWNYTQRKNDMIYYCHI